MAYLGFVTAPAGFWALRRHHWSPGMHTYMGKQNSRNTGNVIGLYVEGKKNPDLTN